MWMKETVRQYTQRILAYQHGHEPLQILSSTPKKIARLLTGVSKKTLVRRPAPKTWSIAEILAHLADGELVVGFRMRLVLGCNGTTIQAYDQDVWARFSRYASQDPRLSFEAFKIQREHNVQLLKRIPRKMWKYYGMHSERGRETISRMIEMMAGHDINHLAQIRRIVNPKAG